jgi:hypothetical protein
MIIERFHPGKEKEIYQRFEEKGRMLPEGVSYINSWIHSNLSCCFQLMQSDTEEKIHQWISYWNDLADFEIIPVITSSEATAKAIGY